SSPSWSQEESLGGNLASEPAAASWSSGRIDVFARGTDNALKHLWYQAGLGKGWQSWESLGGNLASAPAAASWSSGRLDIFARGTDNALKHRWDQAWAGISPPLRQSHRGGADASTSFRGGSTTLSSGVRIRLVWVLAGNPGKT